MTTPIDKDETYREFHDAVNMSAGEIEKWLGTEESRVVGWKEDREGESVGHASGRHIVDILRKKKADLTDGDYAHMRKVVGYVHRHMAQKPKDVQASPWRYSLMNWGHDPQKRR